MATIEIPMHAKEVAHAGMDHLPTELLSDIFSYLDRPAPSDSRLHNQPTKDILTSADQDLKNMSLVCKRWRATILKPLFRHVIWETSPSGLTRAEVEDDAVEATPILRFLRSNDLGAAVETFVMLVEESSKEIDEIPYQRGKPLTQQNENWPLQTRDHSRLDWCFNRWDTKPSRHLPDCCQNRSDNNWIWELVFGMLDPLRFTIMASPRMLGALISKSQGLNDMDEFDMPFHILSLSRQDRSEPAPNPKAAVPIEREGKGKATAVPNPEDSPDRDRAPKTNLFTIRPWRAILVNEGSSTNVYRTYEFHRKRTPSILNALLGCQTEPNHESLVPPSVREFSYVGIFPLSTHFTNLVNHLPRIDKLFVQLVPRNNILKDPVAMKRIEPQDLWMERNTSYGMLMHKMLHQPQSTNWAELREFESGDAADREAWEMAVQYVEMQRGVWRVAGDGLFVRRDVSGRDDAENSTSGGASSNGAEADSSSSGPSSVAHGETSEDESESLPFLSVDF